MQNTLDAQQVELMATASLERELIKHGFEVAYPQRDRGIDLIVFSDEADKPFRAMPIQIKSAKKQVFSVWRKYEKFDGLIFAFIWNTETKPRIFLMSYGEATKALGEKASSSPSWQEKGWYSWSRIPKWLEEKLLPYENRWDWLEEELKG